MPGYDKTGPMGNGPKTGRGMANHQEQNGTGQQCNRMRRRRNMGDGSGGRNCGGKLGAGRGQGKKRRMCSKQETGKGCQRVGQKALEHSCD